MINNLASGAIAGALSVLSVYPIIFARNRLAADNGSKVREFNGFIDVITKTVKNGGPRALFTGFTAGLPGLIMYRMVYFGAFDTGVKIIFPKGTKEAPTLGLWMLAESVTLLAGLSAYPFSTLQKRLQMTAGDKTPLYTGALDCLGQTLANEGIRGLYRGFMVQAMFQTLAPSVALVAWSKMSGGE